MASAQSIKNKLETKVFNKLGSTVSVSAYSASYSKWGDETISYGTASSVTAIPYEYFPGRINYQSFGNLEEGDVIIIFPHDTTIDVRDKVTYSGSDYEVKEVEKFPLEGEVVAIACRLSKIIA